LFGGEVAEIETSTGWKRVDVGQPSLLALQASFGFPKSSIPARNGAGVVLGEEANRASLQRQPGRGGDGNDVPESKEGF